MKAQENKPTLQECPITFRLLGSTCYTFNTPAEPMKTRYTYTNNHHFFKYLYLLLLIIVSLTSAKSHGQGPCSSVLDVVAFTGGTTICSTTPATVASSLQVVSLSPRQDFASQTSFYLYEVSGQSPILLSHKTVAASQPGPSLQIVFNPAAQDVPGDAHYQYGAGRYKVKAVFPGCPDTWFENTEEINNQFPEKISILNEISHEDNTSTFNACIGENIEILANKTDAELYSTPDLNITAQISGYIKRGSTLSTLLPEGTYYIGRSTTTGCVDRTRIPIRITYSAPVSAGNLLQVCANETSVNLNQGNVSPSAGNWSGTYVSANTFNAAAAGVGTHSVTYSYRDINDEYCRDTDTRTIEVIAMPEVSIHTDEFSLFVDNTPVDLSASPSGGSWHGSGITGHAFAPSQTTVGTHQITYQYTNSTCTVSNQMQITVEDKPVISSANGPSLSIGETKTLTVNPGYITYQWKKNGVNIPTTQTNQLVINQRGTYTVVVENQYGYKTTSHPLTIKRPEQIQNINYIKTKNYLLPVQDENFEPDNIDQMSLSTTYYDGLGRPIQTVNTQASPQGNDLITPIAYDAYGRQPIQYLPYASDNTQGAYVPTALIDQQAFYSGAFAVADDPRPYSETHYEPSPLNRVHAQYGPGQAWSPDGADKPVRYDYQVNTTGEVRLWTITQDQPATHAYYPEGQLYKNVTTDEEGHQVIEFVDKQQRTVLKRVQVAENLSITYTPSEWADTYYLYDDFGNLRFVLPPEAIANLSRYRN